MLTVSLLMPEEDEPPIDILEVEEALLGKVDLMVDGGCCGKEPTSIIDLTASEPIVIREGKGDITPFL